MCTVLLPPALNPIAVNKYIDIDIDIRTYKTINEESYEQKQK